MRYFISWASGNGCETFLTVLSLALFLIILLIDIRSHWEGPK